MESINIVSLTVTYSDRGEYVKQQTAALLAAGVNKCYVIDNNSEASSKRIFNELKDNLGEKIEILHLEKNFGSAGGFHIGLEEIKKNNSKNSFVWLLDDDNIPDVFALKNLKNVISLMNSSDILLSHRTNRAPYKKIFKQSDVKKHFKTKNSFHGYDLFFDKGNYTLTNPDVETNIPNTLRLPFAPYGGMFFPLSVLDIIGLPDKSYFLYRDDHEFSRRIIKNGGRILLCLDSKIYEIEVSWNGKSKTHFWGKFINFVKGPDQQSYYSIRNSYLFERAYLVENGFIYHLNGFIFLFFLTLVSIYLWKIRKIKIYYTAYRDGMLEFKKRKCL